MAESEWTQKRFDAEMAGRFEVVGECHIWTHALRRQKHPVIQWGADGFTDHVARVWWKLNKGDPSGDWITTTCGNSNCVNPAHFKKTLVRKSGSLKTLAGLDYQAASYETDRALLTGSDFL